MNNPSLEHKETWSDTTVHKLSESKFAFSIDYLFNYDPTYMYTIMHRDTATESESKN